MGTAESVVVLEERIAGLSAADFLARRSVRPTVYEATGVLGGNCRTIQVGGFRFDNPAATMHFPAGTFMFTRGNEPKNRCATLAPGEMTSFVAEVPCYDDDWSWQAEPSEFLARVWAQSESTGLVRGHELAGSTDERIVDAYPVLRKDYTTSLSTIVSY